MKKGMKIFLAILLIFFIVIAGFIVYTSLILKNVNLDVKKLVNVNKSITFYDDKNNIIDEQSNGVSITNFEKIPKHTINAFISIEDKRFYQHSGIDTKGLVRAVFNNIKTLSLKEGASTISQQLIKNTHLSGEKTLKRKLYEIKLAKQLENIYSKDEILEKYLNTIYFGDGCYGISSASEHFFNISTENLSLNQSAMLAAIIKAPSLYSPSSNPDKCLQRKNLVLNAMYNQGFITKEELNENSKTLPSLSNNETESNYDYLYVVKQEINKILGNNRDNNIKVFTYQDNDLQNQITEQISIQENDKDKSIIILNNKNKIKAYYSTCGEQNRQIGSTIKPILVYAPAIECNVVHSCSPIIDEKTSFNGYNPSNFNDIYYGKVSVKESLAKSLNICSIKLLNYVGIERAKSFINKTDLKLSENDNSLCIALGATEKGAKLSQITSCYNVFNNQGNYINKSSIKKILDDKGKILYSDSFTEEKIFDNATISIMNDMLKYSVKNGTARKLNNLPYEIYAKTGTVGDKNGNTDAYCISYNPEYTIGCWTGYQNYKKMENEITGGTIPTNISFNLWKNIYKDRSTPNDFNYSEDIEEVEIDKLSLEEDNLVELADPNSPERYKTKEIFKKNNLPKKVSTRFSSPKIEKHELKVFSNGILIRLCVPEYVYVELYRENNGKKIKIYDTRNNENFFKDTFTSNEQSIYTAIPYYLSPNLVKHYGEEILIGKIKVPDNNLGDDWWINQ